MSRRWGCRAYCGARRAISAGNASAPRASRDRRSWGERGRCPRPGAVVLAPCTDAIQPPRDREPSYLLFALIEPFPTEVTWADTPAQGLAVQERGARARHDPGPRLRPGRRGRRPRPPPPSTSACADSSYGRLPNEQAVVDSQLGAPKRLSVQHRLVASPGQSLDAPPQVIDVAAGT